MISRMFDSGAKLGLVGAAVLTASSAFASTSASDPFLTINASSSLGSGTFNLALNDPNVFTITEPDNDIWFWSLPVAVPITSGPNTVATLVSMTVLAGRITQIDGTVRWGIDIDYGVLAGGEDTTFELISPTIFFDAIGNCDAITSATRIGTDQFGGGINITPGLASGFSYEALYNGSSVYATAFNSPLGNPNNGASVGDDYNNAGVHGLIPGYVSSIQARFKFSLTANDASGGTSTYSIAPAPGSFALLGLGGLLAARRRR